MHLFRAVLLALVLPFAFNIAHAQDTSLQPKYGSTSKSAPQLAADEMFIASIDEHYKGNHAKAAADVSARGWQLLRAGNVNDAMRRFNQAWLLDHSNGVALWGMAAIQSNTSNTQESLKLFAEAERSIGDDIDFSVDHAKTLGIAGAEMKSDSLLNDAFTRFAQLHQKAPQHVLNLQNWAITLFYIGNYAEAWKKIRLAEAAPRRADLDHAFIAALQGKMPRP